MNKDIKLARKQFAHEKRIFFQSVQPNDPSIAAVYNVSMECCGVGSYRKELIFRDGQSAHRYLEQLIRAFEQQHPNHTVIKDIVLDPENDWRFLAKRTYFDDAEQSARTTFKMERRLVFGQVG